MSTEILLEAVAVDPPIGMTNSHVYTVSSAILEILSVVVWELLEKVPRLTPLEMDPAEVFQVMELGWLGEFPRTHEMSRLSPTTTK